MERWRWGAVLLLTMLVGGPALSQEPLPGATECRSVGFPFPIGPKVLKSGSEAYAANCLSCHGEGGVATTKLGTLPRELYRSVWYGVPGVEGHAFSGRLTPAQAWEVTAYVMSLRTPPKTVSSPTGLQYATLVEGSGKTAARGDRISAHYTGWLTDGTKFDSSFDRGEPLVFNIGVGMVIQGWDEGVVGMKVGEVRQLVIPPSLGYGARAMGRIPANSTLVFQVELVDVP